MKHWGTLLLLATSLTGLLRITKYGDGGTCSAGVPADPFGAEDSAATESGSPALRAIHFREDFSTGDLTPWHFPYPEDWEIRLEGANRFLHMKRTREPGVPRRPLQFARLKNANVGSFEFQARVRREGQSMIVVFNYVDTLHFYYVHLSRDRGTEQPVHNGIFIVNGEPRKRLAGTEAAPALPDREWHQVNLVRDARSGQIEVFIDRSKSPLFSVLDQTFACGQIGIGSFDETGDFDDIEMKSNDAGCEPGTVIQPLAYLPSLPAF